MGQESAQPLIEHEKLVGDGLESLLEHLQSSSHADAIRRAILLETASWGSSGLEESLVLAHAALECAISVFEQDKPLLGKFCVSKTKLQELAKAFVASLPKDVAPSQEAAKLIANKTPELLRPAIRDLIEHHAAQNQIQTSDLWPHGTTFPDGLRAALASRNELVHGRGIANSSEAGKNTIRLRALTERLILHQLGWDPAGTGQWSDLPLDDVNS